MVNKKDYEGEFQLDSKKYAVFAACVECSVSLIEKISNLTDALNVAGLEKDQKIGFVGCVDYRYCGRYYNYNGKRIWIGLSFNNIGFTPDYRPLLQVLEEKGESLKLTDRFICARSQFYPNVDKSWLTTVLDNYLLFESTEKEFQKEINRILKNLNL